MVALVLVLICRLIVTARKPFSGGTPCFDCNDRRQCSARCGTRFRRQTHSAKLSTPRQMPDQHLGQQLVKDAESHSPRQECAQEFDSIFYRNPAEMMGRTGEIGSSREFLSIASRLRYSRDRADPPTTTFSDEKTHHGRDSGGRLLYMSAGPHARDDCSCILPRQEPDVRGVYPVVVHPVIWDGPVT